MTIRQSLINYMMNEGKFPDEEKNTEQNINKDVFTPVSKKRFLKLHNRNKLDLLDGCMYIDNMIWIKTKNLNIPKHP